VFRVAKGLVAVGLSLRIVSRRTGPREHDIASVVYLVAGLAFRYAWMYAGRTSARDDVAAAAMARGEDGTREPRAESSRRSPLPVPDAARRFYGEALRRGSLAIERRMRALTRRA
jgi:hypothetical protein